MDDTFGRIKEAQENRRPARKCREVVCIGNFQVRHGGSCLRLEGAGWWNLEDGGRSRMVVGAG